MTKTLGQVAYEAYKDFSQGKSLISGANLPEWEDQAVEIQAAWEEAGQAAVGEFQAIKNKEV